MYKSLIMVLAAFLLFAGMGLADEIVEEETVDEVATVEFTGIATELFLGEMPGAPTIWTVDVTADEENNFCSDMINVTVSQATLGPWGTVDENVTAGNTVEVYGACIMDETGCIAAVTLEGSADYYLELATEETETEEGEVVEGEVAEEPTE